MESGLKNQVKQRGSGIINPFVDWGFKYLFGTERSKKNLLGFLNLLLDLEYPIVDLHYLNNESIPTDKDGRECIFDILCEAVRTQYRELVERQTALHNAAVALSGGRRSGGV